MSIGIGLIGAGIMGAEHVRIARTELSGAHLAMVADPDMERAKTASAGARVTADPIALVYDRSVDAIVIASPDGTHLDLIKAALAAEKPVLCEKPLATTSEEALEIVRLERRLGRRLVQTGYMRRFDPSYRAMKGALESGELGDVRILHCSHRNASAPSWFVGAMPVTNSLVHEIDACRWLLSDELIAVSAIPTRSSDPTLFAFETAGGVVISVEVFMNATYCYHVHAEAAVQTAPYRWRTQRLNASASTAANVRPIPRTGYRASSTPIASRTRNGLTRSRKEISPREHRPPGMALSPPLSRSRCSSHSRHGNASRSSCRTDDPSIAQSFG